LLPWACLDFISAEENDGCFVSKYKRLSDARLKQAQILWPGFVSKTMTHGEIMATASHLKAWEQSVGEYTMVLEDDAIPATKDTCLAMLEIFMHLPSTTDILFLGGGYPLERVCPIRERGTHFTSVGHPSSNTCVGYLAKTKVLKILLESESLFALPIDLEIAIEAMERDLSVLHLNNYIFNEGSKMLYESNLR